MKLKKITPANNEMDSCFLGNMSDCNDLLIVESLNVCDTVYAAVAVDCVLWKKGLFNFWIFSALKFNFSGDSQRFNMSSRADG